MKSSKIANKNKINLTHGRKCWIKQSWMGQIAMGEVLKVVVFLYLIGEIRGC